MRQNWQNLYGHRLSCHSRLLLRARTLSAMALFWTVIGLLALAWLIGRLVVTVRNDGYDERPPDNPDAWRAGDLQSTPYRLPPF